MGVQIRQGILAAALLAGLQCAQADEPAIPEEVTVTARHLEETLPDGLAQYGTRLDAITREQVADGGYVDLAQTLKALAPGFYIQPKNGPFDYADISLLGSRSVDVLWLIDGVRINNRLYGTTPPLDTLPSSMIDKVEILEGGEALFYGTSALAGAVNVVTRPFTDAPSGSITVGTDTHDGRHFDGDIADGLGPNHVVVYGSSDRSDGYSAFRPQDYQPSATHRQRGYDVQMYGAKYGFDVGQQFRLSATYQHADADLDYALPFRVDRDVNSRREDLATAKIAFALNDQVGFFLKGYYHSWHTRYDTIYNDLTHPGQTIDLYDNAFWGYDDSGVNVLATFSSRPGVSYYVGYDLQSYGGRDEVLVIQQQKELTQAVFAQLRVGPELVPRTHASLGVRFNHPDVGESVTIWTLSGQYDLTDTVFVRATLGTNFRLPSAEELFADDPFDERGSPRLRPEQSKSINATMGGWLGSGDTPLRWELIGYARNITDLIDYSSYDEQTQQDVFGNVPGTVRERGAELAIDRTFARELTGNLSFSYSRARLDGGRQLDRIPEQLAKAGVDYHPSNLPMGITATVVYTGKVSVTTGPQPVQYGKYAVVNLAGRYFFDAQRHHRLNLAVENLFDRQYGMPGQGCQDVPTDGPYDCSSPYIYVNRGLPLTVRLSYTYRWK